MKQFRSLLIANVILYAVEGVALYLWATLYPFSFHTYWAARLGLLP